MIEINRSLNMLCFKIVYSRLYEIFVEKATLYRKKSREKMKLRKAEIVVIVFTLVFVSAVLGFQMGRERTAPSFSIVTQSKAQPELSPHPVADVTETMVNLNTASAEELKTLYGIGDVLAERIIAYRDTNGPFERVEDITNVSGIGSATYEKNLGRMTVDQKGGND